MDVAGGIVTTMVFLIDQTPNIEAKKALRQLADTIYDYAINLNKNLRTDLNKSIIDKLKYYYVIVPTE